MEQVHIVVEELPELETEVAVAGSVHQQEVGGALCIMVGAGIAIYVAT